MSRLVLLRHGQSIWNLETRFTGWTDIELSDQGIREAHRAGRLLKEKGYSFDVAFTSVLKRAIRTLWIILDEMDLMWIPVHRSWRLNERHYGTLQGLDKNDTALKYGLEQVHMWRRGYDIPPPPVAVTDSRHPGYDQRYDHLKIEKLPCAESLKDTLNRVMPYWNEKIVPNLKEGKTVLVSAHGNSLRALIKHIDNISDEDIVGINIPTGIPLVYELESNLRVISHYYLGEEEAIQKATESVANEVSESIQSP